jgi:phosphate starvation-inducible protein PhoH and related proteins
MAYLRGVTFKNVIVLLDEAQNTTPEQMKLFLTRLGEGSKFIITGDTSQSDIKGKSGLMDAIERLKDISKVDTIEFLNSDIVRHPVIEKILERYDEK